MYSMADLLQLVVQEGASDLHIRTHVAPVIRVHGVLHRVDGPPLRPEDTEDLMKSVTPEDRIQTVREKGTTDFGFAFGEVARFRVSVFKAKGDFGIVLRQIPTLLLTLGANRPARAYHHGLLRKPRGLILVTGPTGSGKTTTLASMINIINETRDDVHIITVEDPIEYYHKHKKAIITQREVHVDVPSFYEALRLALRQDPDVILVGELRDLETIAAAITAAETGHLVFGTLHTTGAAKTIDRIVNAFPMQQQETIRIQLSTVLQAVISQLLLPRMRQAGPRCRLRNHGQYSRHLGADPGQQNLPHSIRHSDRRQTRHGHPGLLPHGIAHQGPDFPRRGGHQIPGPHHHHREAGRVGSRPGRRGRPASRIPLMNPKPESISSPLLNLIRDGKLLDDLQLDEVKEEHNRTGKPISDVLNDFGLIDLETQLQIIATHLGTEVIHLGAKELTPEILSAIPADTARNYKCLPGGRV